MKYKNTYKVKRYQKDLLFKKGLKYPSCKLSSYKFNYNYEKNCFAFLGHSSIFINLNGTSILIDPVFSKHVGPFSLMGPKRFIGDVPSIDNFPVIDAILITHNHFDHLDYKTIKSLDAQTKLYIVPKGVKKTLLMFRISPTKIIELNWQEEYKINGITVIAQDAHHNTCRNILDINRSLWCSYVIKNDNYTIFHSGDSAFSEHFKDINNKYKNFNLSFMECGQYGSYWHNQHMFPEESVQASKILKTKLAIPIHWGGYVLSSHSFYEPCVRFKKACIENNINYLIPVINKIYSLD